MAPSNTSATALNQVALSLSLPRRPGTANRTLRPQRGAKRGPRVLAGPMSLLVWASVAAWCQSPQTPIPIPIPGDSEGLRQHFLTHISQPRFQHARWGVHIVSLDTGRTVFSHNANELFIPASNTKLFTGALALDRLGPDHRIRTSLYAATPPDADGVVAGDLTLYGRGDPTLAARFHEGDLGRALAPLVDGLAAAGVRRVEGDLVADTTYFQGAPVGSGWEWDDLQHAYGAEVSALSVNDNTVMVRVQPAPQVGWPARIFLQPPTTFVTLSNLTQTVAAGARRELQVSRPLHCNAIYVRGVTPVDDPGYNESMSVHQPATWFAHLLREQLERRGIWVAGQIRTATATLESPLPAPSPSGVELAGHESPPLSDLLDRMLKPSQNLYAQLLWLQVGVAELARRASAPRGSTPTSSSLPSSAEQAGQAALDRFLGQIGVATTEVLLEEGSGLSRRNLLTPAATVRLLTYLDQHRHAEVFRQALPVAGLEGTLRNRMQNTPASHNARAKTGTLRYVHALSGYVTSNAGERWVFALLLNGFHRPDSSRSARADLDDIVVTLARLPWRSAIPSE